MGRANIDDVSRLDGVRDGAERAGHRRSRDVEYHGDVSPGAERQGYGIRVNESPTRHDRSEETGVRGRREIFGRSARPENSSGNDVFESLGGGTGEADRSGESG